MRNRDCITIFKYQKHPDNLMGFVAEGHNYQDYMISHRWDSEVSAPAPAPTVAAETFAAEDSDNGIMSRITGMASDLWNLARSNPILAVVGVVGIYFVATGLRGNSE